MTPPAATYAPANAVDVFVHNGWTSNYASVGDGYDPTQDWFQVKLATPAPVYEVFSRWTSPAKPTEYDLQVSTDADCQTWSTVTHVVNPSDKDSQVIDRKDPISCVRMQALATNSTTGYTINEFEIWSGPKPPPTVGQIIPVPVKQEPGTGQPWELTDKSRIVVSSGALAATAEVLAGYLRPATGFVLPVVTGSATASDIALSLGIGVRHPGEQGGRGLLPHGVECGREDRRPASTWPVQRLREPSAAVASGNQLPHYRRRAVDSAARHGRWTTRATSIEVFSSILPATS